MNAQRGIEGSGQVLQGTPESGAPHAGKSARLAPHTEPAALEAICDQALRLYGVRVLDNVDLSRLDGIAARAFVIAGALMERGDARAFALGRELLSFLET
jgi:hypothetical protein